MRQQIGRTARVTDHAVVRATVAQSEHNVVTAYQVWQVLSRSLFGRLEEIVAAILIHKLFTA
jgi:hypothetical protein